MLNSSNIIAIEGKFKRNKTSFKSTFLFKENPIDVSNILDYNEICIIYYINSTIYSWYLTNKNLILPDLALNIELSSIKRIDFLNMKDNPDQKLINKELDLFTQTNKFNIIVEENSWPLIYNIFKFIIDKNIQD